MTLQVQVLEQSFERVKPHANEFASSFYQNLLADQPQLKPLFAKTNMEEQQQKLIMSLMLVIDNLRKPDYLKTVLQNLGERHVGYGAIQEHYPMIGEALLKTFESYLGSDWTPEVRQAWIDAYGVIVSMMLEGTKSSQATPTIQLNSSQPNSQSSLKTVTASHNTYSPTQPTVPSAHRQVASTTTTPNLKLLVFVFVLAGLLGGGLYYFVQQNSTSTAGSMIQRTRTTR